MSHLPSKLFLVLSIGIIIPGVVFLSLLGSALQGCDGWGPGDLTPEEEAASVLGNSAEKSPKANDVLALTLRTEAKGVYIGEPNSMIFEVRNISDKTVRINGHWNTTNAKLRVGVTPAGKLGVPPVLWPKECHLSVERVVDLAPGEAHQVAINTLWHITTPGEYRLVATMTYTGKARKWDDQDAQKTQSVFSGKLVSKPIDYTVKALTREEDRIALKLACPPSRTPYGGISPGIWAIHPQHVAKDDRARGLLKIQPNSIFAKYAELAEARAWSGMLEGQLVYPAQFDKPIAILTGLLAKYSNCAMTDDAELLLAQIYIKRGRWWQDKPDTAKGIAHLEHLLATWPKCDSAPAAAELLAATKKEQAATAPLELTIRPERSRVCVAEPNSMIFEVKNNSLKPVEMLDSWSGAVNISIKLYIKDAKGNTFWMAPFMSPATPMIERTIVLAPGQVHMRLSDLSYFLSRPGAYTITAVVECTGEALDWNREKQHRGYRKVWGGRLVSRPIPYTIEPLTRPMDVASLKSLTHKDNYARGHFSQIWYARDGRYRTVLEKYPDSIFAKYAELSEARVQAGNYTISASDHEKAKIHLIRLLETYPPSAISDDAELLLAKNYLRRARGKKASPDRAKAIAHLKHLLATWPKSDSAVIAKPLLDATLNPPPPKPDPKPALKPVAPTAPKQTPNLFPEPVPPTPCTPIALKQMPKPVEPAT